MNYSTTPGQVRVDFFKESGKWYDTIQIDMTPYWSRETLIHDAVILATKEVVSSLYSNMTLVCLEPYHENSHPIMILDWTNYKFRRP